VTERFKRIDFGHMDLIALFPDISLRAVRDFNPDSLLNKVVRTSDRLSEQTVGNILRPAGIPPAPKQSQTTSCKDFIAAQTFLALAACCCNDKMSL
jgi:hypothetical protein